MTLLNLPNTIIAHTHSYNCYFGNLTTRACKILRRLLFTVLILAGSTLTYAQQNTHKFNGTVYCTESNETLTGVNIFSKDKRIGTTTDNEGNFELSIPSGDSVSVYFTFIGYKTREFSLDKDTKKPLIIYLEPLSIALKEVTITSAKNEQSSFNQTTPVNIISQQRINEVNAQNLPDFVTESPSVSLAGAGYHKSISIRGLARKRTLILVDGHRISSERNAGPPGSFVNPLAVKRIEILRGPYSTLYGSDAVGGVVNILTKDYQPGITNKFAGGVLDLNYRSISNGYNANILINGNISKNIKMQVSAGKRKADSYKDAHGNEVMSTNYSEQNLAAKLQWDINSKHKLLLHGLISQADSIGKPAYTDEINALHPKDDHSRIALHYSWRNPEKIFSGMNINTAFHRHEITARVYNYTNTEFGRVVNKQKNLYNNDITYQQDFRLKFSKTLNILSGIDFYERDGIHIDEQSRAFLYAPENFLAIGEMLYYSSKDTILHNSYQRSGGIFAQVNYQPSEKLRFNAGARYNLFKTLARLTIKKTYAGPPYDYSLNEKETEEKKDAAFSGNFGALYTPNKAIKITFNIGQAFRTPSTKELFVNTMTPGGMNISNSSLKPEESLNIDFGIKHVNKNYDFISLDFFRNDISNMIILQWDSLHSSGQFHNKDALIYGIELEFSRTFLKHLETYGNISYIKGEERSGEPLMDIPPFQANLRLSYEIIDNRLKSGLTGRYNAAQKEVATGDVPTYPFFVMDFVTSWKINRLVSANISVTNIFNKHYREHHQFEWEKQAGRSFNGGIQIKF